MKGSRESVCTSERGPRLAFEHLTGNMSNRKKITPSTARTIAAGSFPAGSVTRPFSEYDCHFGEFKY